MARGGILNIAGAAYLSTHNNGVTQNRIAQIATGVVKVAEADDVAGQFNFTANSGIRIGGDQSIFSQTEYGTFIAPFLTLKWWDPGAGAYATTTTQIGNYILLPASKQASSRYTVGQYSCRDVTWVLAADTVGSTYVVTAGTRYVDALNTLLTNAGFTAKQINIASSTRTASKKLTWPPGTTRLRIANDILGFLGYWPLWADWSGVLTSRKIDSVSRLEPVVTFSSANGDISDVVTIDPDPSLIANRVVVIGSSPKNNANGAPIVSVRNNTRADSPTSQGNLGIPGHGLILGRVIQDTRISTQADADALADKELGKATHVSVRMGLRLRPNPAVVMRQPITLAITQDDGTSLASGKWSWDECQIGFTPSDGAMTLRVQKILPYGEAI